MEEIEVRPVRRDDIAAVVTLIGETLAEFGLQFGVGSKTDEELLSLPESYREKGGQFWVAYRGATLLGTCGVVRVREGIYELRKMYLSPQSRGLGLGKRFLKETLDWVKASGGSKIVLDTAEKMTRAIAFYEANGFVRDDSWITGARCSRGYVLSL